MPSIEIIKNTHAYKAFDGDVKTALSHAYALISPDPSYLREYAKLFAMRLLCENGSGCMNCRACRLIESENYSDLKIYPSEKGLKPKVDDVEQLIEESYMKPTEGDKKVFIIDATEDFSLICQNKLLKTLEEPPKNVVIIIACTAEYILLPTVSSRVKTLKIGAFDSVSLKAALKDECTDAERLDYAVKNGDGTLGKAERLYSDKRLDDMRSLAYDTVYKMKKSSEVLDYVTKAMQLKEDFKEFLGILKTEFQALMRCNEETLFSYGYTVGAVLSAIDEVSLAEKKSFYNGNAVMIADILFLKILEGKYKWTNMITKSR